MLNVTDNQLYEFNIKLAFGMMARLNIRPGLKRIASFSYWRSLEEPLVLNSLKILPGQVILDIGSPKTPFLYLASKKAYTVFGTDIQDRRKELLKNLAVLNLMEEYDRNRIRIEKQDAQDLTYAGSTFDRIYSISCLEHIGGSGDSDAMIEIARTLKTKGIAVITIPFHFKYYESFRDYGFYGRAYKGEKLFYQRHYDLDALSKRLVLPSGLELEKLILFGETNYNFQDNVLMRTPKVMRAGFSMVSPLLQRHFIGEIPSSSPEKAMLACLVLSKR